MWKKQNYQQKYFFHEKCKIFAKPFTHIAGGAIAAVVMQNTIKPYSIL